MDSVLYLRFCYVANHSVLQRLASEVCCDVCPTTGLQGLKSAHIVRFYWAILGITFFVAFVVTFVECHPFRLYWQVVPDPGKGIFRPQGDRD
jgi:hypothetical protein